MLNGMYGSEVNRNNLLGGQILIFFFLPKNLEK